MDIFLKKTDAIPQIIGVPPEALNIIQESAQSINKGGSFKILYTNQLIQTANAADVYTKTADIFTD